MGLDMRSVSLVVALLGVAFAIVVVSMRGDEATKLDGVVPESELTSVLNDDDDERQCEECIAARLADLEKAYQDCAAGTCPNTDETVDKIEAELAKAKDYLVSMQTGINVDARIGEFEDHLHEATDALGDCVRSKEACNVDHFTEILDKMRALGVSEHSNMDQELLQRQHGPRHLRRGDVQELIHDKDRNKVPETMMLSETLASGKRNCRL